MVTLSKSLLFIWANFNFHFFYNNPILLYIYLCVLLSQILEAHIAGVSLSITLNRTVLSFFPRGVYVIFSFLFSHIYKHMYI